MREDLTAEWLYLHGSPQLIVVVVDSLAQPFDSSGSFKVRFSRMQFLPTMPASQLEEDVKGLSIV